jgi:hypothetical protein
MSAQRLLHSAVIMAAVSLLACESRGQEADGFAEFDRAIRLNPKDAAAFNNRVKAWDSKPGK